MNRDSMGIAWAAGFLEGEGSFRHPETHCTTAIVEATQVQREPLDRLQRMFGGSIRLKTRGQQWSANCQPIWCWFLVGHAAVGLMMTIYGLMSSRRREQIRLALSRWRTRKPRNQFKTVCVAGHPFDSENTRFYVHPISGKRGRWCRACKRERYGHRKTA